MSWRASCRGSSVVRRSSPAPGRPQEPGTPVLGPRRTADQDGNPPEHWPREAAATPASLAASAGRLPRCHDDQRDDGSPAGCCRARYSICHAHRADVGLLRESTNHGSWRGCRPFSPGAQGSSGDPGLQTNLGRHNLAHPPPDAATSQPPSKMPRRQLKVCSQCRRRKQKVRPRVPSPKVFAGRPRLTPLAQCETSRGGPQCDNCARRFPPVDCVFPQARPQNAQDAGTPLALDDSASSVPGGASSSASRWLALRSAGTSGAEPSGRADVNAPAETSKRRLLLDGPGSSSISSPFGGIITEISSSLNGSSLPNTARAADLLHFCQSDTP